VITFFLNPLPPAEELAVLLGNPTGRKGNMAYARGLPLKKDPRLLGSTRHRVTGYKRGDNLYISPLQRSGITHVTMGKNPISIFGLQIPDVPSLVQDLAMAGGGALVAGTLARVLVTKETAPNTYNVTHGVVGLLLGAAINQYGKSPGLKRFGQLTMMGSLAVAGFNLADKFVGSTVVDMLPENAKGLLDTWVAKIEDPPAGTVPAKKWKGNVDGKLYDTKELALTQGGNTDATLQGFYTGASGLGATMTLADARQRGLLGLGKAVTAEQARRQLQAATGSNRAGVGRTLPGGADVRVASSVAAAVQDAVSQMSGRFTPSFMRQ